MEKKRWEHYLGIVLPRPPAHNGDLGRQRDKLHRGHRKAENSLAVQLRTKKKVRSIPSRPHGSRCDLSGAPDWLAAARPLNCHHLCPKNRYHRPQIIWRGWNTAIPKAIINRKSSPSGSEIGYESGTFGSIFAGKRASGSSRGEGDRGRRCRGGPRLGSRNWDVGSIMICGGVKEASNRKKRAGKHQNQE